MKVSIKRIDSGLDSKYNELIHTFIKFLQKNYQLKEDITIQFVGKKQVECLQVVNTQQMVSKF